MPRLRELLPPLPWEGLPLPHGPSRSTTGREGMERPGCTAADESLVALGHLQGLAKGLGGFGVLRTTSARLEKAAQGAEQMGDLHLAQELRSFSLSLLAVTNESAAKGATLVMQGLADRAWELGKRCGLSSNKAQQALELIKSGRIKP